MCYVKGYKLEGSGFNLWMVQSSQGGLTTEGDCECGVLMWLDGDTLHPNTEILPSVGGGIENLQYETFSSVR